MSSASGRPSPTPSDAALPAWPARRGRWWQRLLPWLITAACFVYLYGRLEGAAAAQGQGLGRYLADVFEHVSWSRWLALMIPYCAVFVVVDSVVVWRVIGWFNTRLRFLDVLPIRASAYILSLVNEQVSKGAIAVYLSRRHGVPAWEVGSSMLFLMFCEYYYLLAWATLGVLVGWSRLPAVFHAIPWLALASAVVFALLYLFFRGRTRWGAGLRERPLLRSFRLATIGHYLTVIALRSPAMLAAIVVYWLALRLFGVTVGVTEMLGYLPVIFFGAAVPGPMHSVAIVFWVLLFPDRPGEMTAFGFVQHNFFVLFNAATGLLFLRRATRELFAEAA
ncbi:MAG TPA: hypothetical protein VJX92_22115 [Methylomirabilota bacterium]|nr:hypothetical protein [Methylomirabilota bacterium]